MRTLSVLKTAWWSMSDLPDSLLMASESNLIFEVTTVSFAVGDNVSLRAMTKFFGLIRAEFHIHSHIVLLHSSSELPDQQDSLRFRWASSFFARRITEEWLLTKYLCACIVKYGLVRLCEVPPTQHNYMIHDSSQVPAQPIRSPAF